MVECTFKSNHKVLILLSAYLNYVQYRDCHQSKKSFTITYEGIIVVINERMRFHNTMDYQFIHHFNVFNEKQMLFQNRWTHMLLIEVGSSIENLFL